MASVSSDYCEHIDIKYFERIFIIVTEIWEKSQVASVSSDYCEHIDMFFIVVRQSPRAADDVCNRPCLEGKHDRDEAAKKFANERLIIIALTLCSGLGSIIIMIVDYVFQSITL